MFTLLLISIYAILLYLILKFNIKGNNNIIALSTANV